MSSEATPPSDPGEPCLPEMQELLALAVSLARETQSRAIRLCQAPRADDPEALEAETDAISGLTTAFERAARAARLTALLIRRLHVEPVQTRTERHAAARRRILREVGSDIHRNAPERAETLESELRERIERAELVEDLDNLTVEQIIAQIRTDLAASGKHIPVGQFKRRTPQDIAALHGLARAATLRHTPPLAPPAAAPAPERLFHLVAKPKDDPSTQ